MNAKTKAPQALDLDELIARVDKDVRIRPVAELTLYVAQPFSKVPKQTAELFASLVAAAPPKAFRWAREEQLRWRAATARQFSVLAGRARKPQGRPYLVYRLRDRLVEPGGTPSDGYCERTVPEWAIEMFAVERPLDLYGSHVWYVAPWKELRDSPEAFRDLVVKCAELMPYHSGHAGYSLLANDAKSRAQAFKQAQAHKGLDVSFLGASSKIAREGSLKGVNWLTLLSWDQIKSLGGERKVRPALDPDVRWIPTRNGAVLQAGAAPQAAGALAAYRSVAQLLRTPQQQFLESLVAASKELMPPLEKSEIPAARSFLRRLLK